VLPEFADGAGLPAAARLGAGLGSGSGESGQMLATPRGDGGAGAHEVETAGEFIGEEGEIERPTVRKELGGESGGLVGPGRGVITAAGLRVEGRRIAQPVLA